MQFWPYPGIRISEAQLNEGNIDIYIFIMCLLKEKWMTYAIIVIKTPTEHNLSIV